MSEATNSLHTVSNDENNPIQGNPPQPHTRRDFTTTPTSRPLTHDLTNAAPNIPLQLLAGPSRLPDFQQPFMTHHTYHPDYGPGPYMFNIDMHPNPLQLHSNVPYNSPPSAYNPTAHNPY